jgi:hypothetical protein
VFRRLRENGPAVLVPLAWAFVAAAHAGAVNARTLLAAHVVMDALLVAFVALSWSEMSDGVLLAWRRVILVGLLVTLAGTAGLLATPPTSALLAVAVYGWMLLPAAGLAYTGSRVDDRATRRASLGGAVASLLGVAVYAAAPLLPPAVAPTLAGLALVGVGQTVGIVAAVTRP